MGPRKAPWRGLAAFLAGRSVRHAGGRVRLRRRKGSTFLQLMTARGKILSQPLVSAADATSFFLKLEL